MNTDTHTEDLEPIDTEKLFAEFGDSTLVELMLTVQELREALELEKKAHSYDERLLRIAEEELAELKERVSNACKTLQGEPEEEQNDNE